ncbi:MAG: 30S ribosomal protein S27ae [Nanoarchaeota archaeon]|nr:30S ribosomal protein S27ae [Nanoarchaeota archaeon]
MAAKGKPKPKDSKAKKKKVESKRWEKYEISGDTLTRKNKFCPKCGPGFFLANHKNRSTCGHCSYVEFKSN